MGIGQEGTNWAILFIRYLYRLLEGCASVTSSLPMSSPVSLPQSPTFSPLPTFSAPHTSGKNMTKYIEDSLEIRGFQLFRPNAGIMEQQESQSLLDQSNEDAEVRAAGPSEADIPVEGL